MADDKERHDGKTSSGEPEPPAPEATAPERAGAEQPSAEAPITDRAAAEQAAGEAAAAAPQADEPERAEPSADEPAPTSQAAAPPPRQPQPRRGGGAGIAALVIVLLVAAGAAAGGFHLWQQQQELRAAQGRLAGGAQLNELEERLQARLERLQGDAARLRESMASLAQERSQADRALVQLEESTRQLGSNQQALAQRVTRLDALTEAHRGDWLLNEAAYLARIAQHRLRFHRDVDAALDALRMADRLLAEVGTEAIAQRQALNRAVDRLVQVSVPDLGELGERLSALIDSLHDLPLAREIERREPAPSAVADPATADDWREGLERAWRRFKETLGELVVIQREGDTAALLAAPERYFLFQNLQLSLESARVALLRGEQALYSRSLEQAANWLEGYFAAEDQRVQRTLAELEALAQVQIAPSVPDLSQVLQPLTERD